MMISKYQEIQDNIKKDLDHFKQISTYLSIGRIIVFLLIISSLFFIDSILLLITFLLLVAIFIVLIIFHNKNEKKVLINQKKIDIINNYISKIDGTWKRKIQVDNTKYIDSNNCSDLDIFGVNSLFTYLNRTKTKGGEYILSQYLKNHYIDNLTERQEAISEFNFDFSLEFEANLNVINSNVNLASIEKENIKQSKVFLILGSIISFFTFLVLIIYFLELITVYYLIIPSLFQIGLLLVFLLKNKNNLKDISNTLYSCLSLYEFFRILKGSVFKSKLLNELSNDINNSYISVKKISSLASFDSARKSFLLLIAFNLFFSSTILIIYLYASLINKHKKDITRSIEAFETFEALNSLASIKYIRDDLVMPKRSEKLQLSFENLKHPLINLDEVVGNDYINKSTINIISGSNMSGKTSFMRTIGINTILMNAGTYVCASKFESSYYQLFTSMRLYDDINKGVSTFYSELLKIKEIIDYNTLHPDQKILVLIDEVFRGTNSNDRILGAISLIKKLNKQNVICFITTHDLELCQIEISSLSNYHFSEYYVDDKIYFPYKLMDGKCNTTNAKYLMKLVGIND